VNLVSACNSVGVDLDWTWRCFGWCCNCRTTRCGTSVGGRGRSKSSIPKCNIHVQLRWTLLNRCEAARRTHRLLVARSARQNVLRQACLTEVVSATQGRHGVAEGILADRASQVLVVSCCAAYNLNGCGASVLVHCRGHRTFFKLKLPTRQVLRGVKPCDYLYL